MGLSLSSLAGAEPFEPTVLSMASILIEGNPVVLPQTQRPDGSLCQAYVAHVEHSSTETTQNILITVDQFCGVPQTLESEEGAASSSGKTT